MTLQSPVQHAVVAKQARHAVLHAVLEEPAPAVMSVADKRNAISMLLHLDIHFLHAASQHNVLKSRKHQLVS